MKKLLITVLGALCALSLGAAVFAGCGDRGNSGNGGNGGGNEKDFTITIENGEGYTAKADKTSADMGETVTITVTVTNPDMYIERVLANSNELDENSDGKYTATVTTNLTIKVEMGTYTEVLSDGGLTYDKAANNNNTVITNSYFNNSGIWDSEKDTFIYTYWDLAISADWSSRFVSDVNERLTSLTSSNQAVIPDDAITYEAETSRDQHATNGIIGFTVRIDTTKIALGETWLNLHFQGDNGSSPDGTLCIKINVVDKMDLETMKESVVIDFNGFAEEGDDVIVRFYDKNYLAGTYINDEPAERYTEFKATVEASGKHTFTFDYIKGHSYTISICKSTEWISDMRDEENQKKVLYIEEKDIVFGNSSSVTGYNQYKGGVLSLVDEGLTVELKVDATFYDRQNNL